MKAIIARGPGQLTLEEVADPDVEPGSVLVRTRVTAVSAGTELRMLYGPGDEPVGFGPGWPVVGAFGYLASGDVVAVGNGVQGIAIGDRVACGTTWGAHQEILRVDAESVQPLPSGLGYLEGACAYWAVPPLRLAAPSVAPVVWSTNWTVSPLGTLPDPLLTLAVNVTA